MSTLKQFETKQAQSHRRHWMKQLVNPLSRHCEERSDVAIQLPLLNNAFALKPLDRRAALAMTAKNTPAKLRADKEWDIQ